MEICEEVIFSALRYGIPFIYQLEQLCDFILISCSCDPSSAEVNFNSLYFLCFCISYRFCYINDDAIFKTAYCGLYSLAVLK